MSREADLVCNSLKPLAVGDWITLPRGTMFSFGPRPGSFLSRTIKVRIRTVLIGPGTSPSYRECHIRWGKKDRWGYDKWADVTHLVKFIPRPDGSIDVQRS